MTSRETRRMKRPTSSWGENKYEAKRDVWMERRGRKWDRAAFDDYKLVGWRKGSWCAKKGLLLLTSQSSFDFFPASPSLIPMSSTRN